MTVGEVEDMVVIANLLTAWKAKRVDNVPDIVGDEMDSIVLETITYVLLCLVFLYSALAVAHSLVLAPEQSAIMVPVASFCALVAGAMFYFLRRKQVASRYAYIMAYATYLLALINTSAQMWVMHDLDQSTNFALLFIGIGLFFLAKRYVALTYLFTFVVWGGIALSIEDPENERVHFLFMMILAMILGVLAHSLRLRSTRRLIHLRSEALVREGELAVALNEARLYAAAEKENKAKTEFLANMSHELRTPLNAILGFSEVMKGEMFGPHGNCKYKEYSNHIHTAGDHLLSLVNDILDLSRIQLNEHDLQIQPVDINRICANCITIVRHHAERGKIKLTFDVPNNIPEVLTDARRLKQILTNLLNNSVKFTPPDGSIHLEVKMEDPNRLRIRVTDSGIGMNAEELENATKPFWQAQTGLDRNFEGTGLGLALVSQLLQQLDGELVLKSAVGKGTQATVYLPVKLVANTEEAVIAAE